LQWGVAAAALMLSSTAWAQTAAPAAEPAAEAVAEVAAEPEPEVIPPAVPPTSAESILRGRPIFEVRARYEEVDQVGIARKAQSLSVRTRAGWETAEWNGLKGVIEFEDVRAVGGELYNVAVPGVAGGSLNGKTQYPLINDPEVTEVNRAQITWTPSALASFTVGRQRLQIEDQRFIGSVSWRQDEQTFDAAVANLAYGRWKATYAYVGGVNRVLGQARDWDSDSHVGTLTYSWAEPLRVQGFAYLLDFKNAAASSTATYGVKASGKTWVGLFQVAYNGTWAHEKDYGHNTTNFSLDYWSADVAGTFDIWNLKASYEVMEGNGVQGFITPLGTTHLFQGWADAFAANGGNKTFVDGIKDANLQLTVQPRWRSTYLFNLAFIGRYHDFDAERGGHNLGHEWNVQGTAAITANFSAAIKYARFTRAAAVPAGFAAPPASRDKIWLTFEYRL
jgi:hypothetical protein